MGDAENALPPSKKRAAGRELSRDNPGLDDEEGTSEQESGTFKRASDDVMASRRIVKVRRHQTSSVASAPSSNPFAGIQLVPPSSSSIASVEVNAEAESRKNIPEEVEEKSDVNKDIEKEKDENGKQSQSKVAESTADKEKTDALATELDSADVETAGDENTENAAKKEAEGNRNDDRNKNDNGGENVEKSAETASFSSFQQLSSSQNAFTGLAGTGFSSSTFSFGTIPKDGSQLGSGFGSLFGLKNDQPSFAFGLSNNGNSSLFGNSGASIVNKSEGSGFPSMQEVPVETGEENEKAVFTADSVLFEFLDGRWKERGKGEIKVNVSTTGTGKARLIMRSRGNYRLILNASLYPDMKLTNMDKKGISFACVNSTTEGNEGLSTIALKFKDASIVEEFRTAVTENKGEAAVGLKTPENSPKALDG